MAKAREVDSLTELAAVADYPAAILIITLNDCGACRRLFRSLRYADVDVLDIRLIHFPMQEFRPDHRQAETRLRVTGFPEVRIFRHGRLVAAAHGVSDEITEQEEGRQIGKWIREHVNR